MTTLVPGPVARQVGLDSFVGFTQARVVSIDQRAGVTFDAELDQATVDLIAEFIRSRSDADQACRENLRALHDAVVDDPSLANIAALTLANTHYLLGD